MATFISGSRARYPNTGAATESQTGYWTTDILIQDLESDSTFEVGDPIYNSTSGLIGTYAGTYDFGGSTFHVVDSGSYYFLYASGEPAFPSSITVANIVCFLEGTIVATARGQLLIEEMRAGDAVITCSGEEKRVLWIGRQTVSTRFGPADRLMPVRFAAGSLGEGLPHSDLTVTADHGMLVDGVICHAGALVNGTTITRVPLEEIGETYTVYHIETESHEIILANGAPAETFIDNVSRRVFDNYAEFEALYGDVPEMEELSYPRAMSARQVPERIRAKLTMLQVA